MMLQVRTNDLKKKKIHLQTWGPYVESESDVLHCLLACPPYLTRTMEQK